MVVANLPQPFHGPCEHLRPTVGVGETMQPLTAAADIYRGLSLTMQCSREISANSTSRGGFIHEVASKFILDVHLFLNNVSAHEVWTVIGLAVCWTIARYLLSAFVFKPLANFLGVQDKNVTKLCESGWKTAAYGLMWGYAFHIVFFRDYNFFYEPMQQFADWSLGPLPHDLALLYGLELSFYLHSVYATLFMDAWRKDSVVLMVHHFVSMTLISFSYVIRCVKVGVLIFVLNDIGDIFLEGGKVATYLRHRKSGFSWFFNAVSDLAAVFFAISWVINRLWFHLTKVWRGAALGVWASHPILPIPFHMFLNVFLATLYAFYIYWFWFIVVFLVRIFTGKSGTAEDPREDKNGQRKRKPAKVD